MDPVKSGAIFRARDGTPLRSPFPKQMLESPASASALSTVFRPQARRPDDFVAPSPFVPQRPSHGSLHQSTPAARNGAIITPGSHSLDQRLDHLIMSSPVPKVLQHQLQSRGLDLVVSPSTPSATSNRRPMASFSVEPRRLPDHLLPNRTPNAAARPAVASPPAYQPAEGGQSFSWSSNPADLSGFTNGPAMRSPAQSMDSARRSMPPRFLPENQSSSTPSVSSSVSPHVAARSDWDRANGRGSHGTPSPAVMPTPAKPKGTPFTYRKANVETPMRQSAVDSTPNLGDVLTAYSQTRAGGSGSGTGTAVDVRARPSSTNSASAPFPDSELDLRQDVFQDVLVAETQLDPDEEVEQPVIDQLDQPEPSAVVNAGSILDSDQDADIDAPTGAAMDVVNASATDGAPLMSMAHSSVPQRNGSLVRESVFVQPQGDDRYPVETILTSERGTTFRKGGGSHATIVTLSFTPLMTLLHSPSQIPDSEAKSSGAAPSDSVMDDAEEEVRSPRSASGKRSGKATVTPVAASSKSVRSTGRARTASTPQKAESSSKQEVVNVDDSSDSELEARAEVRSSSAQLSSPARRSALKSTTPAAKAASSPSKATSSTPKTRTPAVTFDATPSSKNGGSSAAEAVPSHSRTRTTSPRDTKTPVKDTSAAASKAGLVTPTNQKTTPAPTGSTGRRLIKPESRRQSGPVVSDATDSKPKSKSKSEPARRSDRAARASQPSGASSRAAIKRTDEVATELRHWHVELLLNDETHGADVVLVGLRAGESELWRTNDVVQRHSAKRLRTASGHLYALVGNMTSDMPTGVFPASLISAFRSGFPENWEELLQDYLDKRAEDGEPADGAKVEVAASSSKKTSSSKAAKSAAKSKGNTVSKTTSKSDSKSQSAKKASSSKGSSSGSGTTATARTAPSTPVSSLSLLPVAGTPLHSRQMEQLNEADVVQATTKSGRQVIRPLAHWMGEHLLGGVESTAVFVAPTSSLSSLSALASSGGDEDFDEAAPKGRNRGSATKRTRPSSRAAASDDEDQPIVGTASGKRTKRDTSNSVAASASKTRSSKSLKRTRATSESAADDLAEAQRSDEDHDVMAEKAPAPTKSTKRVRSKALDEPVVAAETKVEPQKSRTESRSTRAKRNSEALDPHPDAIAAVLSEAVAAEYAVVTSDSRADAPSKSAKTRHQPSRTRPPGAKPASPAKRDAESDAVPMDTDAIVVGGSSAPSKPRTPPTKKTIPPLTPTAPEDWSDEQLHALQTAYMCADPTKKAFWATVARHVQGKTAAECQAKYEEQFPTPSKPAAKPTIQAELSPVELPTKSMAPLKKRKLIRKFLARQSQQDGAVDDIFESTPFKKKRPETLIATTSPAQNGATQARVPDPFAAANDDHMFATPAKPKAKKGKKAAATVDASPAITAEERAVALSQPISKPDEDAAPYLSSDLAIDTPYRKTAGTDRDKADSYIERLKKSHKAAAGPAGKRGKGKSLGIAGVRKRAPMDADSVFKQLISSSKPLVTVANQVDQAEDMQIDSDEEEDYYFSEDDA